MQYELFYLVGVSKEAQLPEIKKEVETTVETAGGKFLEKETLEKRRLSYKIKHENHGIYLCRRFELEEIENISEIIKNLNLNIGVLRFLISKTDELPALKSKEERMEDAAKRDNRKEQKEIKPETKKSAPAKKEEKAVEEKAEVKSEVEEKEKTKEELVSAKDTTDKGEDIDKKLEEILNI